MPSYTEKLTKRGLIRPPDFVPSNVHYECLMGSHAYGTSTDSSDRDVYGFCIPRKDVVFPHLAGEIDGFGRQKKRFDQFQLHHIKDPDALGGRGCEYDLSIYNIVRYLHLCLENNPNMLDSLFVPADCILHITAVGSMVRERRRQFLHKGAWPKLKGYAYSQLSRMGGSRSSGIDEFTNECDRLAVPYEVLTEDIELELKERQGNGKAVDGRTKKDDEREIFRRRESVLWEKALGFDAKENEDEPRELQGRQESVPSVSQEAWKSAETQGSVQGYLGGSRLGVQDQTRPEITNRARGDSGDILGKDSWQRKKSRNRLRGDDRGRVVAVSESESDMRAIGEAASLRSEQGEANGIAGQDQQGIRLCDQQRSVGSQGCQPGEECIDGRAVCGSVRRSLQALSQGQLEQLLDISKATSIQGKRRAPFCQNSFDVKFAAHTVRLLYEAEMILAEGDIDLRRHSEHLKAIRRGEVPEEEIRRWAADKERDLEALYAKSALPWGPDEPAIKQLLLDCLEHHYGSLAGCILVPDAAEQTLGEIRDSLARYDRLKNPPEPTA